jgi:hypothetical protein
MNRWAQRNPILTALILVLVVAVPGFLRQEAIINTACHDRQDHAILLRGLVELSDDGNGTLNLTGFESFGDLDPETQRYLTDLEEASRQAPRPSEFVKNALALVDVPDC